MEPIFASSSGVEGQWMEALVVLVAWCWWLLLKISSSQTKNKLEVTGLALDPDMEAMAGSVCSSVAVAQDLRLVFVALHGDENGIGLLILVLLLADMHQGSIEAAPGSPSTAVVHRQPSKMVVWRPLPSTLPGTVFSD
jgi:hypothetical protein